MKKIRKSKEKPKIITHRITITRDKDTFDTNSVSVFGWQQKPHKHNGNWFSKGGNLCRLTLKNSVSIFGFRLKKGKKAKLIIRGEK